MGKKVKVVTKCGETFFYDHDQEVETVEIVEETYDKKETIGTWTIYYFDDAFLVVNDRDTNDRFEFEHISNGWINTKVKPTVYEDDLTNDI